MKTMIPKEYSSKVAEKCNTNPVFTEEVIREFLNGLSEMIANGGEVSIPYVGTLTLGLSKMGLPQPMLQTNKVTNFYFRKRMGENPEGEDDE